MLKCETICVFSSLWCVNCKMLEHCRRLNVWLTWYIYLNFLQVYLTCTYTSDICDPVTAEDPGVRQSKRSRLRRETSQERFQKLNAHGTHRSPLQTWTWQDPLRFILLRFNACDTISINTWSRETNERPRDAVKLFAPGCLTFWVISWTNSAQYAP